MRVTTLWVTSLALASSSIASFFPPTPKGLKIKQIEQHPGLSISYKEVNNTHNP